MRSRILILPLAPLLLCGCHTLEIANGSAVTRTIVVRPIESGSLEKVDAVPEFLGAATYFSLHDIRGYEAPLNWITECGRDGTMRITWTTFRHAKERLYLTEAGFYPVEVPLEKAIVINQRNQFAPAIAPIPLLMTANSAYLPRHARVSYRAKKLPAGTTVSNHPSSAETLQGGSR